MKKRQIIVMATALCLGCMTSCTSSSTTAANSSAVESSAESSPSDDGMEESVQKTTGEETAAADEGTAAEIPENTPQKESLEKILWSDRVTEPPALEIPDSLNSWKAERNYIKAMVKDSLGELPPIPDQPNVEITETGETDLYTYEKFQIDNEYGDYVPGTIYIPKGLTEKAPAILYLHYHGNEFETGQNEVIYSWPLEDGNPLVNEFLKRGYIVQCIDAYAFTTRSGQGPGIDPDTGEKETGLAEEASLYKYFTVQGISYMGMILRDDIISLNYLASRPEVDAARIGTTGMSMGGTRANWLTALDDRIQTTVSVACLTRMQDFIKTNNLKWHAFFNWVPGMLQKYDTETVACLIAPRPYMQLMGDIDIGSPVEGVKTIEEYMHQTYKLYGKDDNLEFHYYENLDHDYLPEQFYLMLDFFDKHLKTLTPQQDKDVQTLSASDLEELIQEDCSNVRYSELLMKSGNVSGLNVFVSGQKLSLAPAPYMQNGGMMIPLTEIAEAAHISCEMSQDQRTAELSCLQGTFTIRADSDVVQDSVGNARYMPQAASIRDGVLFVPVSLLSDVLGIHVVSFTNEAGEGIVGIYYES